MKTEEHIKRKAGQHKIGKYEDVTTTAGKLPMY